MFDLKKKRTRKPAMSGKRKKTEPNSNRFYGIGLDRYACCYVRKLAGVYEETVFGRIIGFVRDGECYERMTPYKMGLPMHYHECTRTEDLRCHGETHAFLLFSHLPETSFKEAIDSLEKVSAPKRSFGVLLTPISRLKPCLKADIEAPIPTVKRLTGDVKASGRPRGPAKIVLCKRRLKKDLKKPRAPKESYTICYTLKEGDLFKKIIDDVRREYDGSARAIARILPECIAIAFEPDLKDLQQFASLCESSGLNAKDAFADFLKDAIKSLEEHLENNAE